MDIKALRENVAKWLGKYKYIALIVLLGVGLMMLPFGKSDDTSSAAATQPTAQERLLDRELEEILSNISGAGKVQVMLTVRAGATTMYQTDTPSADRQDTVIITGQDRVESGLVQQIISPTYRGAIVLCQGADDPVVCLAIKNAVSKVTGLDSSEISVLKMK